MRNKSVSGVWTNIHQALTVTDLLAYLSSRYEAEDESDNDKPVSFFVTARF